MKPGYLAAFAAAAAIVLPVLTAAQELQLTPGSHISYRNTANVAATEVDFGLVARGNLISIARDTFPIGTAFPYCAVMRVKYADGSVWENPHPPMP